MQRELGYGRFGWGGGQRQRENRELERREERGSRGERKGKTARELPL